MKVLVTGGGGMLGVAVVAAATDRGHEVTALTHGELDISDAAAVRAACRRGRARGDRQLRRVDRRRRGRGAEEKRRAVNGEGAGNLARAAAEPGRASSTSRPTTSSTATSSRPYVDPTRSRPLSAYGRSKLAGERAVAAAGSRPRDRPHRVAVRRRRGQLRRHDALAGGRPPGAASDRRPGRLADLDRAPRTGAARARGDKRDRHLPRGRGRAVLALRAGAHGDRARRARHDGAAARRPTSSPGPPAGPRSARSRASERRRRGWPPWQEGLDGFLAARETEVTT